MLTPHEIEIKKFRKGTMGYRADEVDDFLDQVYSDYSQLYKDNAELSKKLSIVVEKLEEYREQEESFKNAIIQAQRLSDSMMKDAKNRAELTLKDSQIKSEKMIDTAQQKVAQQSQYLEKIKQEVAAFRSGILEMYKSHIEMIKDIPVPDQAIAQESKENETAVKSEPVTKEPETVQPKAAASEPANEKQPVIAEEAKENKLGDTQEIPKVKNNDESSLAFQSARVAKTFDSNYFGKAKPLSSIKSDNDLENNDDEDEYDKVSENEDEFQERTFLDKLFGRK